MRKNNKVIALAIVMLGFVTISNAQSTATATATATVVSPISLAKTADMNFGNIAVGATGGTVILAPAGTRTATGGVTLPAAAGTIAAAAFTVTGSGTSTYVLTLPTSASLISGAASMAASSFTSSLAGGTGTLAGGTQNFTVGATLTVAAAQAAGIYVSGNFDVTVNYN